MQARQQLIELLNVFTNTLQAPLKGEKLDEAFLGKYTETLNTQKYYTRITQAGHQPLEVLRCTMEYMGQLSN